MSSGLWLPDQAIHVVAVQTAVRRQRYIRAASWATVVALLEGVEPGWPALCVSGWRRQNSRLTDPCQFDILMFGPKESSRGCVASARCAIFRFR
jgi:hypothetical protein